MTRSTLSSTRRDVRHGGRRHRHLGCRGFRRMLAFTVVLSMTLLGVSGVAQAKTHPRHHHLHGGGGGTTTPVPPVPVPPVMVVSASPNPVVETGDVIMTVVQVETSPSFAGDMVNVSSSQLANSCLLIYFIAYRGNFGENVDLTLDNEGNATVEVVGEDCAPGPSLIVADLDVAPYYTAVTTLQVQPPEVSVPGVTGYPNPEVETGDENGVGNNDIGNSDVFAVFEIEADPVYAGQTVDIASAQLEASCLGGWVWISPDPTGNSVSGTGVNTAPPAIALLDDDGNAVFGFYGRSCAAGPSVVVADVEGGTHPTYVTTYTVSPPTPTI